jgi:competence protein ComEC
VRAARPLSARRPLAWSWWLPLFALGLVGGQSAGDAGGGLAVAAWGATCACCPALWLRHRRVGTGVALVVTAELLGALQGWSSDLARSGHEEGFPSGPRQVEGRVVGVRPLRARGAALAAALDLDLTADAPPLATGDRVRVTLWSTARTWVVGEVVRGRVPVLRVPRGFCNGRGDGFARAMWRQGILGSASASSDRGWVVVAPTTGGRDLEGVLHAARAGIRAALLRAVPDTGVRAVLAALVYGDQSDVPAELRRAYARTGTAHVLSVSGLHIAVVAMTCFAVVRRLLARWPWLALRVLVVRPAALLALVPATLYALLSGGAVATMRSLMMAAVALAGVVLLRRADVGTALAAAAVALCATDPGVAEEPSFQLSFVAVVGLVVAGRRWEAWRKARGWWWLDPVHPLGRTAGTVGGAVVAAIAAGLATGPFTAFHFGSVATLGVVANLFVVPLVGWLALLLALAGAVLLPLARVGGEALLVAAGWCIVPANAAVTLLASSPWCALDVALATPLEVACACSFVAALCAPAGRPRRCLLGLGCALVCVRAVGVAGGILTPRLEATFLDVGQGDAVVVRLPRDAAALVVDGGGLGGTLDPGERVVVPALRRRGVRMIDAIALSHPDFDHYGGLASVLQAFPVGAFWSNGRGSANATFTALLDAVAARAAARRVLVAGETALRAGGAVVRVVHPHPSLAAASDNDASLVLVAEFGATRVLMTGDVQAPGESALLRTGADVAATVVKVPHHGSRTSSSRALVARTQPGLAVALLGAHNRFGFPAAEVRRRWRRHGARWLQTDQAGEVVVWSDGQLEEVVSCRQEGLGSGEEPGADAPLAEPAARAARAS